MIKPVARINVVPNLPDPLRRLQELAYNLRWAWDHETIALFRRLDRDLWEQTGHNPVWMLGRISLGGAERPRRARRGPPWSGRHRGP